MNGAAPDRPAACAAAGTARRRLDPRKLLLSKWTAVQPHDREKHFLVTELVRDEHERVVAVELQAVLSRRSERLPWRDLQDTRRWHMGWR